MAQARRIKFPSREFAGLSEEEKVRVLMEEQGLTERRARQFLSIGRGESTGDQREPIGRGPAAPRAHAAQDEQLKEQVQQILDAPKDQPITIDKGHAAPNYASAKPKKPKSA